MQGGFQHTRVPTWPQSAAGALAGRQGGLTADHGHTTLLALADCRGRKETKEVGAGLMLTHYGLSYDTDASVAIIVAIRRKGMIFV